MKSGWPYIPQNNPADSRFMGESESPLPLEIGHRQGFDRQVAARCALSAQYKRGWSNKSKNLYRLAACATLLCSKCSINRVY